MERERLRKMCSDYDPIQPDAFDDWGWGDITEIDGLEDVLNKAAAVGASTLINQIVESLLDGSSGLACSAGPNEITLILFMDSHPDIVLPIPLYKIVQRLTEEVYGSRVGMQTMAKTFTKCAAILRKTAALPEQDPDYKRSKSR